MVQTTTAPCALSCTVHAQCFSQKPLIINAALHKIVHPKILAQFAQRISLPWGGSGRASPFKKS
jgi:hypothetical protein